MRMIGTGQAPQGYKEVQVFDVPDTDIGTIEDLERKGWARRLDPVDDPGRDKVSIANAMVRGDDLTDPHDAAIAAEIGSKTNALAIVHGEDPDATPEDYEEDAKIGRSRNQAGQPLSEAEIAVRGLHSARFASGGESFNAESDDHVDVLQHMDPAGSGAGLGGKAQNEQRGGGGGGSEGGSESGGGNADVDATDSAREYAQQKGINLSDVTGTGSEGKVTKADVEKYESGS